MRTGPAPKNRNANGRGDWIDVPNVPYAGPRPSLPPAPGIQWFPQVEGWWDTFTTMPHCTTWEPSDWVAAIELAYLKQSWWAEYFGGAPTTAMATEIRRREDNMGFTAEARRKLGIRYIDAAPAEEAAPDDTGVTDIRKAPSRRGRLAAG